MPTVTFVAFDGATRSIEAADGISVMEVAVENSVPGIDGDCGGNCACATCHVFVDEAWIASTGERSEMEAAMLDYAEGVAPNSRLACQITMTSSLDGLVVRTPAAQH